MIRSVFAVAAGLFTSMAGVILLTLAAAWLLLGSIQPDAAPTPAYLGANVAGSLLFAAAGGYVTASLSGRARVAHGAALAALMLVMSLLTFAGGSAQPLWYAVTITLASPAFVLCGAAGRAWRTP
jgi:peptidoglycan/LPS O-acetylase OafA/YrhL